MSADPAWRLRRASITDAAALSLVAGASFLETFATILAADDIFAHVARNSSPAASSRYLADPATVAMLVEVEPGNAPIGYSLLTPPDLPVASEPGDIELKRLYLLATHHRSGIGGALMMRALDDACANGARRMLIAVHGQNERARRFYEKHGFAVIGTRQFLIGATWHNDVIYARPL